MDNATITMQFGSESREVEVYFNYQPEEPATRDDPGCKEELELIKIFDIEHGDWLVDESDTGCLLEVMYDDIVAAIKEELMQF